MDGFAGVLFAIHHSNPPIITRKSMRDVPIDLVVNLGCGLDCRPYRLNLPATLKWWDVDFPHVLEHKAKILQAHMPVCQLERIALDLLNLNERQKLTDRIACESRHCVMITEGVLIYLTPRQAGDLVQDLAGCTSISHWISDIVSPIGLQWMKNAFDKLIGTNVEFKFALADPIHYVTSRGWQQGAFHSLMQEYERAGGILPIHWAFSYYPDHITNQYQSMAGVMVLEK